MTHRLSRISVLFVAAVFLEYWALLVYCDVWRPAPLGLRVTPDVTAIRVLEVSPGTPGAAAGFRPGDRLVSLVRQTDRGRDDSPLRTRLDWMALEANLRAGQPVGLAFERDGQLLERVVTSPHASWTEWRLQGGATLLAVRALLLLTIVVAAVVAFQRSHVPTALVGSLFLATMGVFTVTLPYGFGAAWRALPWIARVPLWLPFMSSVAIAAWGASFFTMFPRVRRQSPAALAAIWTLMLPGLAGQAHYGWHVVAQGRPAPPFPFWPASLLGPGVVLLAAALVRAGATYARLTDLTERRRVRVVMLGLLVGGLGGAPVVLAYWQTTTPFSRPLFASPIALLGTALFLALPLSFAYAILRHRLFDLRVIVRQGLRYVLARRVLLAAVPALALLLVADLLLHRDEPLGRTLGRRAWIYGAVAAFALVARAKQRRWLEILDRRFFREQYNGQRLLRQVADDLFQASALETAAPAVVSRIEQVMHPQFVALLVREGDAASYRTLASAPGPVTTEPGAPGVDLSIPVPATGPMTALLALGPKRSEEPYSADDRELLQAVAGNIALRLEGFLSAHALGRFAECPRCGRCELDGSERCPVDAVALATVTVPRSLVDRYRVEQRIGHGGMGTVYVARDTLLDRRVAVKVLREALIGLPGAADRFRREAQAMAAFAHPNIVTVHDFGISGTHAFLVMELLEGGTLREALDEGSRFDGRHALAILRDVATALEAAHRRQIVHRDLKPENIWLVSGDERGCAKVLDFGLATVIAPADAALPGGGDGSIQGTPLYMAPEQIRGEDPDRAWDVWALSVIAFEMMSGVHPWAWPVFARGGAAANGADDERLSGWPRGLAASLTRALSIRQDRRPASAAILMTELEQSLHV